MIQKDKIYFKKNTLEKIIILLYFIAISAYQLGKGFDAIFVRLTFIVLFIVTICIYKKIKINAIVKWSIIFWGYYALSILWAKDPLDTKYYLLRAIQIIVCVLSFSTIINSEDKIDIIMKLLVFSMVYTSLLVFIRTPATDWGKDIIGSVVGMQRNALGLRLSICFIISLHFFHQEKTKEKYNKTKTIYFFITMIMFLILTLLTASKKACLIIFLGFILYELFNSKGIKFFIKCFIIFLCLLGLIYAIFNIPMLYNSIGRRLESTLYTITGSTITSNKGKIDGSLLERQFFIKEAKELFYKNPIIGYGGNNFMTRMREINYKHVVYCHNNFLELLSTLGILGFSIYYYFWGYILFKLLVLYKDKKGNKTILFLLLNLILLIMDYGNVSYTNEFNIIILIISYMYIKFNKEKVTDI